jgi:hypothetical protein
MLKIESVVYKLEALPLAGTKTTVEGHCKNCHKKALKLLLQTPSK